MEEFEQHLDTARLWWDLDDAVVAAIISGTSTTEPFRRIALYTQSLKAAAGPAPDDSAIMAAVTKIAIRLAAEPGIRPLRDYRPSALPRVGRVLALAALGAIVALGLLIAGDAAHLIDMPQPIRALLENIGITTDEDTRGSDQGPHWSVKEGDANPPLVMAAGAVAVEEAASVNASNSEDRSQIRVTKETPPVPEGEAKKTDRDPKEVKDEQVSPEEASARDENDSNKGRSEEARSRREAGTARRPERPERGSAPER